MTRKTPLVSLSWVAAAGALALLVAACPDKQQPDERTVQPTEPTEPTTPAEPSKDPAVADIDFDMSRPDDPSRSPRAPAEPPDRVAARYVLILHRDVEGAASSRGRAEAMRRAQHLSRIARKKDVSFKELARKYSEVPEQERGMLVVFARGEMAKAFEAAAFSIGAGQVSEPVDTPFGVYVIDRVKPEEYSTAHILVQYIGAEMAPPAIKRTKEQALERATKVHGYATREGANFAVLAERYSDSPSRIRGGVIKPLVAGQADPNFNKYIEAVAQLEVGQVSPVVETPFGYHIIKRLKLERIGARHILISFDGSAGTPREKRNKSQAELLARQVLGKVKADGADFAALAEQHSDCSSADKGGDLGTFARGMMVPKFEQMAFGLEPNEISPIVETKFGYHIIQRTE